MASTELATRSALSMQLTATVELVLDGDQLTGSGRVLIPDFPG